MAHRSKKPYRNSAGKLVKPKKSTHKKKKK